MFWFFGCEACGILAPQPGIEPAPPALESKVLTTGRPGKSRHSGFYPQRAQSQGEKSHSTSDVSLHKATSKPCKPRGHTRLGEKMGKGDRPHSCPEPTARGGGFHTSADRQTREKAV